MKFLLGLASVLACVSAQNAQSSWIKQNNEKFIQEPEQKIETLPIQIDVKDIEINSISSQTIQAEYPKPINHIEVELQPTQLRIIDNVEVGQVQQVQRPAHQRHQKKQHDQMKKHHNKDERQHKNGPIAGQERQHDHRRQREEMQKFGGRPQQQIVGQSKQYDPQTDEQLQDEHHKPKHSKRFRLAKHLFFIGVIALILFFLVRKCIKKNKNKKQKKIPDEILMKNPQLLQEKMNEHYEEIQRLQRIKARREQQLHNYQRENPIIYYQNNYCNGQVYPNNHYFQEAPRQQHEQQRLNHPMVERELRQINGRNYQYRQ